MKVGAVMVCTTGMSRWRGWRSRPARSRATVRPAMPGRGGEGRGTQAL